MGEDGREVVPYDLDPETHPVLRTFLQAGVVVQMPAKRSKRLVVLDYVAQSFEPGRRYDEREVDIILGAVTRDSTTARRYLVDEGFLTREPAPDRPGWVYWRSGGTVRA